MRKNQHVVKIDNRWGVRGEGNSRLTSIHKTQQQAISISKGYCQEPEGRSGYSR